MSAAGAIRSRARMVRRLARERLPEHIGVRLLPPDQRYDPSAIPAPVRPPDGSTRLLIAPANFAAQGYAWARAAERLPQVGAVNMQFRGRADYGFPADYAVAEQIYRHSFRWGRQQRDAVGAGFSHVAIEAERAVFGAAFDRVVAREVEWMRGRGIQVLSISHGTDIRLPGRHAQLDEWSPFRRGDADWVAALDRQARANQRVLDAIDAPEFVSTPEMLLDRPGSRWLPIVVDPDRWSTDAPVLEHPTPVIVHAPTNPLVKGTALVEPVVEAMASAGTVDYRRVLKVPADRMPGLYADADVVLEQFALGMYSVTAVEAMAAGRLVIGHVHDQVRDHVRDVTGHELPVVEATPDSLRDVLHDVVERRETYREIAATGPRFVAEVHDGRESARVLAPFLGAGA